MGVEPTRPYGRRISVRFGATDPAIYCALLSKIYGRFNREKELTSNGLHREILCMIAHRGLKIWPRPKDERVRVGSTEGSALSSRLQLTIPTVAFKST